MREAQLAAGGRQVAPTFPLIGAHSNLAHSNLSGVGWGGWGGGDFCPLARPAEAYWPALIC